jgi:hypothetical protein
MARGVAKSQVSMCLGYLGDQGKVSRHPEVGEMNIAVLCTASEHALTWINSYELPSRRRLSSWT